MYRVILANTLQEANAFAREQGWMPGSFRAPARAASIRGLREAEVFILPSFASRLDRHALLAVLRYTRGPRFNVVEGWTYPAPPPEPDEPELPFDTSATVSTPEPVTVPQEPARVVKKARRSTRQVLQQTNPVTDVHASGGMLEEF